MVRAAKIISLMTFSLMICGQALPAGESTRSINIIPIGAIDRPLPTLRITTNAVDDPLLFHYTDVVSDRIYGEIGGLVRKGCAGATGQVNMTTGEFGTIVVEERVSNGNISVACRMERPKVDVFVSKIAHMYKAGHVESDAIATWRAALKRGH